MKITFVTTGGTIDKDYPKSPRGYAFEIEDPAVDRILERINPNFEYEIVLLLKKNSQDITDEDREMIHEACSNTASDKIIITHGTDTILDTAKKMTNINDKVIILVGSQKPEKFYDSDADFNIGCAVGAINLLENGVYIGMNGRIYPWDKCKRDQKTGQFIEI